MLHVEPTPLKWSIFSRHQRFSWILKGQKLLTCILTMLTLQEIGAKTLTGDLVHLRLVQGGPKNCSFSLQASSFCSQLEWDTAVWELTLSTDFGEIKQICFQKRNGWDQRYVIPNYQMAFMFLTTSAPTQQFYLISSLNNTVQTLQWPV